MNYLNQYIASELHWKEKGLKITQQTREEDMAQVREIYARAQVSAEIAPFFNDLPARIAAALAGAALDRFFAGLAPRHPDYAALRAAYATEPDAASLGVGVASVCRATWPTWIKSPS